MSKGYPDSKVHGAHMGPTWVWQDPGGPHVGHVNFAIWVHTSIKTYNQLDLVNFTQLVGTKVLANGSLVKIQYTVLGKTILIDNSVKFCCNTCNFLQNIQARHPIACPWGRGMDCFWRVITLAYVITVILLGCKGLSCHWLLNCLLKCVRLTTKTT